MGRRVAFDGTGLDRVEFLVAPNPGEGLKPLARIASGGETSRLMLALKNVLAKADQVPTLIFDEIDQGIGGRVGGTVGEKLWHLGRAHQVFVITHLPQLAVFGDQHYPGAEGDREEPHPHPGGQTERRTAHPRAGADARGGERGHHPLGPRHPAKRPNIQKRQKINLEPGGLLMSIPQNRKYRVFQGRNNWVIIRVANQFIHLYNLSILSAGVSQPYGTK